jgi:hypothetical protein
MDVHPTDGPDRPRLEELDDRPELAARHEEIGDQQRRGRRRNRRGRSHRHEVPAGSSCRAVARPVVRETSRVAQLVQQDDGRRDPGHRPAVQEDRRRGSGGAAGEAGAAGEGRQAAHRATDDDDERRPTPGRCRDDRAPPGGGCTRRRRLARLDQHARQVRPDDRAGADRAVPDALAGERRERLVEHRPVVSRVAGDGRDEQDARRLDHCGARSPRAGNDGRNRQDEGGDHAHAARSDDGRPVPDRPPAPRRHVHGPPSWAAATSTMATASSR